MLYGDRRGSSSLILSGSLDTPGTYNYDSKEWKKWISHNLPPLNYAYNEESIWCSDTRITTKNGRGG